MNFQMNKNDLKRSTETPLAKSESQHTVIHSWWYTHYAAVIYVTLHVLLLLFVFPFLFQSSAVRFLRLAQLFSPSILRFDLVVLSQWLAVVPEYQIIYRLKRRDEGKYTFKQHACVANFRNDAVSNHLIISDNFNYFSVVL